MTMPSQNVVEPDQSQTVRWMFIVALLAAGSYTLARYIGLGPAPGPWAYWPINGLLCGVFFRRPVREWAYLTLAAISSQVLTILVVRGDLAGGATIIGAVGNAAQALLGAWLLRRFTTDDSPLENPRVLAWFVTLVVAGSSLLITPITAAGFALGLDLPLRTAWWPLFVGNSLSMLIFAPLTMQRWTAPTGRRFWLGDTSEDIVCLASVAAVTIIAFNSGPSWIQYVALPYAVFPLLAWAAMRSGARWTAACILTLTTIASWSTARGHGPFARQVAMLADNVTQLEAYLVFVALTALLLSALTEQRRRSFAQSTLDEAIRTAFFESSSTVIVLKEIDGRYLMVNRATENVYGVPREKLIGHHPAEFIDEQSARIIEAHDQRVLDRGEAMVFEETLVAGGRERQFLMTRFPVRDAEGVTRYLGMIGRDETVERELSTRLQRAQRVELVGQMAAGLAHDLNNLLFVLVSDAQMLRERTDRTTEEGHILREMTDAGDQATRLTSRLLSLGRTAPVERGPVHVDASLRELEPLLRALVRGRIELTLTLQADGAFIISDRTAVEQIVLNLVANARDAIPTDGRIEIATWIIPQREQGEPTPIMMRLQVTDSGTGMDTETVARIFEPFFTTKSDARGTGLGLYTTMMLVQQAGGTIHVTSEPGAGTRFDIDLPVREWQSEGSADDERTAPATVPLNA